MCFVLICGLGDRGRRFVFFGVGECVGACMFLGLEG